MASEDELTKTEVLDSVPADVPATVATPEGDNEFAPDQPLKPLPAAPERPRGNEPHTHLPLRDAQD